MSLLRMAMQTPRLAIFARWPEPGKAKTRLIPRLGAEGAAALYRKLLEMTVGEARASGLPFHLRVTGGDPERFVDWLTALVNGDTPTDVRCTTCT